MALKLLDKINFPERDIEGQVCLKHLSCDWEFLLSHFTGGPLHLSIAGRGRDLEYPVTPQQAEWLNSRFSDEVLERKWPTRWEIKNEKKFLNEIFNHFSLESFWVETIHKRRIPDLFPASLETFCKANFYFELNFAEPSVKNQDSFYKIIFTQIEKKTTIKYRY